VRPVGYLQRRCSMSESERILFCSEQIQNFNQVHGLASILSSSFRKRRPVDGRNLLTLQSDVLAIYIEDALPLKRRWISTRIRGIMCRGVAVFLVLIVLAILNAVLR